MQAWLVNIAKWLGLNIILPWLTRLAKNLIVYLRAKSKLKKEQTSNTQRNQEYEKNPTDDSFGNSA